MMDISMYGNHHTSHTNGFQSPDIGSGGYPYFSAASHHHHHHHIQSHQMHSQNAVSAAYVAQVIPNNSPVNAASAIQSASNNSNHLYSASANHPHLYSPTAAIEYGIHTSSANNSPSEQYYEHGESGFYNAGNGSASSANNNNGSPMPENHIISSDNGLSYTNLDYIAYQQAHGNQAYLHGVDEKVHIPHHYDEMLMAGGQTTLHHHGAASNPWHHGHNHGYPVESSGNLSNQINIATMSGNNLTSQQHSMHSPSGIQPTQSASPTLQNQQQQSQQQQNVPQYKWMQVKRNVPKPQSEFVNYFFGIPSTSIDG